MADSYYEFSSPDPGVPCQPNKHNFAPNGKCWGCNHYKEDLLRGAEELLKLHGRWPGAKKKKRCIDCRKPLPEGHPHGYCPAREDSGYF